MIKLIIKFSLSFVLSFSLLCLPYNNRPLFLTLYNHFGQTILKTVNQLVHEVKHEVFPQVIGLIKSEPKIQKIKQLSTNYLPGPNFQGKKFTAEEKHLMMKVLLENQRPE